MTHFFETDGELISEFPKFSKNYYSATIIVNIFITERHFCIFPIYAVLSIEFWLLGVHRQWTDCNNLQG